MNKILLAVLSSVIVISLAGCKTSYREGGGDSLYRPVPGGAPMYYTEYTISDHRVAGQGKASVVLWLFQISEGKYCTTNSDPNIGLLASIFKFFSPSQIAVDNAKKAALYNSLTLAQADQMLGTVYEYTVTDYFVFIKVECDLKGFPATAKCVKLYDRDKYPVILNSWQKIEYITPQYFPADFSNDPFKKVRKDAFLPFLK